MPLLTLTHNPAVATPEGTSTTLFRFDENQPTGVVIGTIRDVDVDLNYRITGQTSGATRYGLASRMDNGQRVLDLVVIAGGDTNFNFEGTAQHQVTVEGFRGSATQSEDAGSFAFNLNNINERPTGVWLNSIGTTEITVQENQPLNTQLATLGVVDPDGINTTWGRPSVTYAVDPNDPLYPDSDLYTVVRNGNTWRLVVNGVLDYEALPEGSKFHIVKVIATDGGGLSFPQLLRVNITNDPNEGPANQAPSDPEVVTGTLRALTEGQGSMDVATVESDDDGVGGALRYELTNNPGDLFSINATSGVITFTGSNLNYENNTNLVVENGGTTQERKYFNVQVRTVETGTNGLNSGTTTVKVYVNDVNEAPTAATYAVNTMSEDAQVNSTIGTIRDQDVIDPDTFISNRNFRFTLADSLGNPITSPHFQVNSVSGLITVGPQGLPNVDVVTVIKIYVLIRDQAGTGERYLKEVDITVNPVVPNNTPPATPTILNNDVQVLTEELAGVVNVATVESSDDGVGGTTLGFELRNTFGGLFSVNTVNGRGVITFNGTAQQYENNPNLMVENEGTAQERKYFNVEVRATESGAGGLKSIYTTVRVYLNDVNEAISDATYAPNVMNENAQAGTTIAAAPTVVDPDTAVGNRNFRYVLANQNGVEITSPNFVVNANTGVITVGASGLPNVSVPTDVKIYVLIKDRGGAGYSHLEEVTIRINPNDVNSPPGAPDIVNNEVLNLTEAVAGVVNVATVESDDDGVGGTTLGYELRSTFGGLFSVSNAGVITFNGTAQQYENNPNLMVENEGTALEKKYFNVEVRAVESGGGLSSGYTTVRVYLNDVNEAISDATYTPNVMSENAQVGTTVAATPTVVDPDTAPANRNFRYVLVDDEGVEITVPSNFAVDATTGEITVGALGLPDVSVPTDVKLYVRIRDQGGTGYSHVEEVTVRVNPVTTGPNQAPQSIALSSGGSVDELAAAGVTVASFTATDPDDTGGFVYSLVNSDGRFEIVGNELKVKDGFKLDYEQFTSHTVTVRVTDKNGTGLSHTQNFTIAVRDVNPEVTAGSSADDVFYGGAAADFLSGALGNDSIYGGLGADTLNGDAGNDVLKGNDDKDKITGGLGDDKLWGGYGNDTLWGGVGKDIFVFDGKLGTSKTDRKVNFDTIKDYSVKDDAIWLDNDLFKSNKKLYAAIKKGVETKPLKMASKFFTVGDKAKDKDDYFVYDAKKRVLYYDADGSGSKAAIEMATFTNNKALKGFGYKEFFFI